MKNQYKRVVATLVLFCFFTFAQSNRVEANPAAIAVGVVALGSLLYTAGAVKYYKPPAIVNNTMSDFASLGRIAVATWDVLTDYGIQQMNSKIVTLKTSYSQLVATVVTPTISGNTLLQSTYPALRGALLAFPSGDGQMHVVALNETVKIGSTFYKVDSFNYNEHTDNNPNGHPTYACNGGTSQVLTATTFCYAYDYVGVNPPLGEAGFLGIQEGQWHEVPPVIGIKTPSQLVNDRNNNLVSPYNDPAVQSDIDRLIENEPNIFTPVDTATPDNDLDTAPPFNLPANVINPATRPVTPHSTAIWSSTAASAANQTVVQAAQKAVDDYKAAHPGANAINDSNLATLEKTLADAKTQLANTDAITAENAVKASELPSDNTYDTNIDVPVLKSIGTLLSSIIASSPIAAMINTFRIDTINGVCKVSCGQVYGREFEIDLCRYESTFISLGGVLLIISHGFAVLIVVRGWRDNE